MTIATIPVARRSLFFQGFWQMIRRPGAFLWAYAFNLAIAVVFSLRLHAQAASLLDHSMAAQRLNGAFDLETLASVFARMGRYTPSAGPANFLGLPVWLLVYFLLVPGALFCYRAETPARLGSMLQAGLCFFWRFIRITLLTVLGSALVLGPLLALSNVWSSHVEEQTVGVSSYWHRLPMLILVLLVASALRLYFDLVEVYTVQLDGQYRPSGKPDRRVRRALIPAAKTLGRNWVRALGTFLVLAFFGAGALFLLGRVALHTLAQPRVLPAFLLVQIGLLINLAMRYWQRAAESVLVADNPILWSPVLDPGRSVEPGCMGTVYPQAERPMIPPARLHLHPDPTSEPRYESAYPSTVVAAPAVEPVSDPIPDPEPPVPPVDEPAAEFHLPSLPPRPLE